LIDSFMLSKDKAPPSLTLNKASLQCHGQARDLLSGSIHYWRLLPSLWSDILARCKDLGLTFVCTYVPWSVHEPSPGSWDFAGPRNLQLFCELAAKNDLPVLLRPGPHINAEITGFGYPPWILNNAEILARNPTGSPVTIPSPARAFHVPSYASKVFWQEVERFFDALAPQFAPLFAPGGPAVAVQADNENSFFFRTAPFDQDYHPDAITQYREFLRGKYKSPEQCANSYGTPVVSFDAIAPPKRYENGDQKTLLRLCDWVEYKETLAKNGVLKTAKLLRERLPSGSQTLIFHNYPPCNLTASPFDVYGIEQEGIEIQGIDFYPNKDQHEYLFKQCRTLLGCSRFPFIPEMGNGASPWIAPVTLEDQQFTIPYCFMHGIKGMNFYMFVERERWLGSPIAETGRVRPEHKAFFAPFLEAMRQIAISSLETPTEVVIMASKQYQRIVHATYLLSPIPPLALTLMGHGASLSCSEHRFGHKRNIAIEFDSTLNAWIKLASELNIPVRIVESNVELEKRQRALVLVPSFEELDEELCEKLKGWARDGSKILFGPERPALLSPDHDSLLLEKPDKEALEAYTPSWAKSLGDVQAVLKVNPTGQNFVFFANILKEDRTVALSKALQQSGLRKVWGHGAYDQGSLKLPAKTVSVFSLDHKLDHSRDTQD
jgi:beta-galactosidase